jgi:putative ABC transport system substrate-binding protein
VRRREFITLLGGAAIGLPLVARAQPTHLIPKVGWLKIQGREHTPGQLKAFREGMKALGLVEGRDFVLEERYAGGDEGRLPGLATELIDSGVAIIVATSQPSIAAAWRVTKSVPVIGRMVDDPVVDGMARSLARPGGNITGIYTMTEEMNSKRLALLKEAVDETYRQLAGFVSKLLHATPPGELPIELPTSFELVINKHTADDIGLSVPQNLLTRADKVIE